MTSLGFRANCNYKHGNNSRICKDYSIWKSISRFSRYSICEETDWKVKISGKSTSKKIGGTHNIFQAPIPAGKWNGTLKTQKERGYCYTVNRYTKDQTEDCLYINIYAPILENVCT